MSDAPPEAPDQPQPASPHEQQLMEFTEEQLQQILSDPAQTDEIAHALYALEKMFAQQSAVIMQGLLANQLRAPAPVIIMDGIALACGQAFQVHRQWIRDCAMMKMRYMTLRMERERAKAAAGDAPPAGPAAPDSAPPEEAVRDAGAALLTQESADATS